MFEIVYSREWGSALQLQQTYHALNECLVALGMLKMERMAPEALDRSEGG